MLRTSLVTPLFVCAIGMLALAAPAAGAPAGQDGSAVPAVFEAARARGDAGHADPMEPSDPLHQNPPSPEEVVKHLRAKGWSEAKLSSLPVAEVATAAANIEQRHVCSCGCPRQSIYDCNCRTAATLRGRVLDELARLGASTVDLATEDGRDEASQEIVRILANEAEHAEPGDRTASPATWMFVVVSLGVVAVVVVRRRRARRAAPAP